MFFLNLIKNISKDYSQKQNLDFNLDLKNVQSIYTNNLRFFFITGIPIIIALFVFFIMFRLNKRYQVFKSFLESKPLKITITVISFFILIYLIIMLFLFNKKIKIKNLTKKEDINNLEKAANNLFQNNALLILDNITIDMENQLIYYINKDKIKKINFIELENMPDVNISYENIKTQKANSDGLIYLISNKNEVFIVFNEFVIKLDFEKIQTISVKKFLIDFSNQLYTIKQI